MSTILVADDDRDLLTPLCRYLSSRDKTLRTLAASSGEEGIAILESEQVDVVLSDLRMPEGDGIDILAYLSGRVPPIPVILMSGYVESDAAESLSRFGRLRFLSKPASLERIFEAIQEALRDTSEMGSFNGFSLAGILQLVEMEAKTCSVEVQDKQGQDGCFVFVDGCLQSARRGELVGEDAALELLCWESPEVRVRGFPDVSSPVRQVACDVTSLLMRSVQLRDEMGDEQGLSSGAASGGFSIDTDALAEVRALAAAPPLVEEELRGNAGEPAREDLKVAAPGTRAQARPRPAVATPEAGAEETGRASSWRRTALAFPVMAGLFTGYVAFTAGTGNGLALYGWVRTYGVLMVYLLVVAEALKTRPSQAVCCLLVPPYQLFYVPRRVTSPLLRAAFFAVLVALAAEAFLMPSQSLLASIRKGVQAVVGL